MPQHLYEDIKIDSSWLISASYNKETEEFIVEMAHATYKYFGVPEGVFFLFFMAESKGQSFNFLIRDSFPYQQIA